MKHKCSNCGKIISTTCTFDSEGKITDILCPDCDIRFYEEGWSELKEPKIIMNHKHQGAEKTIHPWGVYYKCSICGKEFESWKRKIINWFFWKWRFFCSIGENYIADLNGLINVMGGLGVIFMLMKAWWNTMPGGSYLVGIWAFQKVLVFWLGYMDVHHWHIFQNSNVGTMEFNPPQVESLERLRNIERILCEGIKPENIDKGQETQPLPYKKESVLDNIKK